MTVFAVTVLFRVRPDDVGRFLPLMSENARMSALVEPGCLRFDVLTPRDGDGSELFLYELYADRAAFDAHLASAHYKAFDAATRAMILEKRAAFYTADTNEKSHVA